jgi:hypothetical protein
MASRITRVPPKVLPCASTVPRNVGPWATNSPSTSQSPIRRSERKVAPAAWTEPIRHSDSMTVERISAPPSVTDPGMTAPSRRNAATVPWRPERTSATTSARTVRSDASPVRRRRSPRRAASTILDSTAVRSASGILAPTSSSDITATRVPPGGRYAEGAAVRSEENRGSMASSSEASAAAVELGGVNTYAALVYL